MQEIATLTSYQDLPLKIFIQVIVHIPHSRNGIIARKGIWDYLTTVMYYELFIAIIAISTPTPIRKEDIDNNI